MEAAKALILAVIWLQPVLTEPVEERVTMIERNHFYDEGGRPVFTQDIFWEGDLPNRNRVRAWRLVKGSVPCREGRGWVLLWDDGGTLRRVRADSFVETWTQFDPELAERAILDPSARTGFKGEK